MELKNQVCSEAQAIRLKELGVIQKSLFYWHPAFKKPVFGETVVAEFGKRYTKVQVCNDKKAAASAFTVAEIGARLPDLLETNSAQYELILIKDAYDTWLCRYCRGNSILDTHPNLKVLADDTLANVMGAMLIHLLEIGQVTSEQVNEYYLPSISQNDKKTDDC